MTPTLEKRQIYLFGEINSDSAVRTISKLNYLAGVSDEPITLYICSEGGSVYDGLALYGALRSCPAPVTIVGMGMIMSMAVVVFLAGKKRILVEPTRVMVHGIYDAFEGDSKFIESNVREHKRLTRLLIDIFRKHTTNNTLKFWKGMVASDNYMSEREALTLGIATEVI